MLTDLRRGAVALAAFTVLVGLAYPLLMFGVGQAAFRGAADGSLVWGADGRVVGSRLIGQSFDAPGYFWGRPSAAGDGDDAGASGASNLGPTSARLAATVQRRVDALLAADPGRTAADIPAELVTASGSGLDPDISRPRPSSRSRGWRPPAGSTRRGSGPWCDGTPGAATSASWASPG